MFLPNKFRPYSVEEVRKLRGSFELEHTLARLGATRLWQLFNTVPYVKALGALTGNQAVQQVKAGLDAIYLSGWQVAADQNLSGNTYPDQSLYPSNSVPNIVKRVNSALLRADQIEHVEGGAKRYWLAPIIADAEAGFGGPLNSFELMKSMIEAGAAGVHFEDQLSSEKRCGHLGSKVLVPIKSFIKHLVAARLAADVCDVPTVLIARTDADSASWLTTDADERDLVFIDKDVRSEEGFYKLIGDPMERCVARGLAYAPYADMLWMETSHPDLEQAKVFAEGIHAVYPNKMLAYNCFRIDTEFVTNSGVKSFEDFSDGDSCIVLTHTGSWQKAKVKNYGKQQLNKITFDKGKGTHEHTVYATPNHRWLLTKGKETTNLSVGDKILSAPHVELFDYDNAEPFEKLYWCYGYVYGDGTLTKKSGEYRYSMVRLCKRDSRFKNRFEEMGWNTSTSLSLEGDFMAYTGSYLKTLPDSLKDHPSLIKAFMYGWLDADAAKVTNANGFRYKSIQSTGETSLSFLKQVLPMCGFYITSIDDYTDQVTNFGERGDVTQRINISINKEKHNRKWRVVSIEEDAPNEEVWCLEVENDNSFVLPFGIVTGNCSPSFNWKSHLSDTQIAEFQDKLGELNYKFSFITLAGFHALNASMFELSQKYKENGMSAYVDLQQKEFDMEPYGYTAIKHQREVGTSYFDTVRQIIDSNSDMSALKGSTEDHQFHKE